jgi:hypothetical protein
MFTVLTPDGSPSTTIKQELAESALEYVAGRGAIESPKVRLLIGPEFGRLDFLLILLRRICNAGTLFHMQLKRSGQKRSSRKFSACVKYAKSTQKAKSSLNSELFNSTGS